MIEKTETSFIRISAHVCSGSLTEEGGILKGVRGGVLVFTGCKGAVREASTRTVRVRSDAKVVQVFRPNTTTAVAKASIIPF